MKWKKWNCCFTIFLTYYSFHHFPLTRMNVFSKKLCKIIFFQTFEVSDLFGMIKSVIVWYWNLFIHKWKQYFSPTFLFPFVGHVGVTHCLFVLFQFSFWTNLGILLTFFWCVFQGSTLNSAKINFFFSP